MYRLFLSQLFVRRVFITDDFNDMMPKYLNFVKGVVSPVPAPAIVSIITFIMTQIRVCRSTLMTSL